MPDISPTDALVTNLERVREREREGQRQKIHCTYTITGKRAGKRIAFGPGKIAVG